MFLPTSEHSASKPEGNSSTVVEKDAKLHRTANQAEAEAKEATFRVNAERLIPALKICLAEVQAFKAAKVAKKEAKEKDKQTMQDNTKHEFDSVAEQTKHAGFDAASSSARSSERPSHDLFGHLFGSHGILRLVLPTSRRRQLFDDPEAPLASTVVGSRSTASTLLGSVLPPAAIRCSAWPWGGLWVSPILRWTSRRGAPHS